jgi:methylthioxylose transferase
MASPRADSLTPPPAGQDWEGAGTAARGRSRADRVPALIAAATLLTIAVGLIAKAAGVDWHTPAQPLTVLLRPRLSPWAALGLAILAVALYAGRRLLTAQIGPIWFGLAGFALTLLTRLALNGMRSGPSGLYDVFVVRGGHGEGRTEYLPALSHLERGAGWFLDHFDALVPVLPVHAAGNPPGLLLSMDALGIDTAQGLAALTIVVGAMATPALYALARQLFAEPTARAAALLFVFVPASLLYGATSADAMYVTPAIAAAACLVSRRASVVAIGAAALAIASFFSYALLAVGAWAALVRWRRDGLATALRVALLCGAALVAFYAALGLISGFDVLAVLRATNERYHDGIAHLRPYLFYLFGSPAAFLVMLGPVAWFAARSLGARETTAVALAVVIAIAALAGFTKGETERIWVFLVPLACLSAARSLRAERLPPLLVLLAAQAIVIEALFATKW